MIKEEDRRKSNLVYVHCKECNATLAKFDGAVFEGICPKCGRTVVATNGEGCLTIITGRRTTDAKKSPRRGFRK